MFPAKLNKGDEIRVISPAESLTMIAEDQRELAVERLKKLGVDVTFSTYSDTDKGTLSTPIEERISDIHEAFRDPKVKMILTTIGGFDSNQLLRYIDYDLIKENPKIFCGFSDITALSNAFYRKTGLVTYSGPHFSTFGMKKGISYTWEYFEKIFTQSAPISVLPAEDWSDDTWFLDQENRNFYKNKGYEMISPGEASGRTLGGNLCTLNLLHGTEYMPPLEGAILFLEDDEMTIPQTFDRDLQSLIHQPGFEKVKGLVIGRFQKESSMTMSLLKEIILSKEELRHIPVIAQASFGHTTPRFTFPIGGEAKIRAEKSNTVIEIVKH
ncbi:S66 peptidase family protein [Halobacillus sp. BBL2006]|uniref:S66 family peptidase n=1 Tax=Halobacillus sp. BBL2006 TaxID=1543706 RepID=UPI0005436F8A|nr:S66 peptidase family protein [Halobacillus sp. BBL2006]KHE68600.1 peptidase S66 [Halobacillus sp. BBL2006]